ncbi:GNAT family N-acetyltransferase [Desulfocurvus sp. DL9XJH121]
MLIRKAVLQDLENVWAVHVASIRRLCKDWYTAPQIAAWTAALAPALYAPALAGKVFLVAEGADLAIQGMAILDPDAGEVCAVYVHPDHAGKGVGHGLLAELEAAARGGGLAELAVKSTLGAKGFYLRNGYQEHEAGLHRLPDGTSLACIAMTKRIAPGAMGPKPSTTRGSR